MRAVLLLPLPLLRSRVNIFPFHFVPYFSTVALREIIYIFSLLFAIHFSLFPSPSNALLKNIIYSECPILVESIFTRYDRHKIVHIMALSHCKKKKMGKKNVNGKFDPTNLGIQRNIHLFLCRVKAANLQPPCTDKTYASLFLDSRIRKI